MQVKSESHEGVRHGSIIYGTVHLIVSWTVDTNGLRHIFVRFVSMACNLFRHVAHGSREAEADFDPHLIWIKWIRWVCPFAALGGGGVTGRAHWIDMATIDETAAHGVVTTDGQRS